MSSESDTGGIDRSADHVLIVIAGNRAVHSPYHIPHPERPDRPLCEDLLSNPADEYQRRDPESLSRRLCKFCDPDTDVRPVGWVGDHDMGTFEECARDGCEFGAEVTVVRSDTGDRRTVCPPCGRRIVDGTPGIEFPNGERPPRRTENGFAKGDER